ncbi:MmcQ/YjbR family DNA-binding protein [Sphingomonas sp.]|uniref:MmcQ/YjbR family DNA-binding protein n=1 Tax=Sphingomonas sp. TaxID=28214 RepID=UPI0025DA7658|nr:MmcQ/YjbR family DNA-binding protein [Sphingomonas sp.]
MNWDAALAFALSLPDVVEGVHYGKPAAKLATNGRAFLGLGREPDRAFVLHLDLETVALLVETAPDSFYQTPHYEGWPAVLVRHDAPDEDRVRALIERARDQAAAMPKARRR